MTYSAKAREIAKEILRVEVINGLFDPNCMREAIEEALIKFGNEREAIGYGKGKEEAKKERPTALARDIIGYCLENDVLTRAGLAGLEKRIEIALNPDVAKIYAALLHAANKRMDANSNSKQERELDLLADVIVAYEQEAFPELDRALPLDPQNSEGR